MSESMDTNNTSANAIGEVQINAAASAAAGSTEGSVAVGSNISAGVAAVGAASTMTMTMEPQRSATGDGEILQLTLANRPGVTWDENVIDNEGLGRKSSKRCCIFHKQRAFGESSTDTSDYDSDSGDNNRKIARKKLPGKKKTPDHLRFHA